MPLTQERNTPERHGKVYEGPAAAAVKVFAGGIAAIDASGNITKGATSATLRGVGRIEESVDNTGGGAGAQRIQYRKGVFPYNNSAGGDEITRADIGKPCYLVDDETVAKTAAPVESNPTRGVAGIVDDITSDGVWVRFE